MRTQDTNNISNPVNESSNSVNESSSSQVSEKYENSAKEGKKDAPEEDVSLFKNLVSSKKQKGLEKASINPFEKNLLNLKSKKEEKNSTSNGSEILSNFQNLSVNQEINTIAKPASALSNLSVKLVERIIVSSAALDNKQEVNIKFGEALLPGTDVRISKSGDNLTLNFVSSVDKSTNFLQQNQADLKIHLMDKLDTENVKITVNSAKSEFSQNDGRSKNQREYFDESEDSE